MLAQLAPKPFWWAELISQFFCRLNISSENFTCPSGKLATEFSSPITKSTSPGLSDMTFFARWVFVVIFLIIMYMHNETIIMIRICVCGIWNSQGLGKCYQEIITFSLTIAGYCSRTVCLLTAKLPVNLFSSSFTLAYPEKPWHWAKVSTTM